MFVVGLTGGIGAGKSCVADLLAQRGAVIVDADVVARRVMAPGGSAYAPVAQRFDETVGTDGIIDRRALAATVFADPTARAELEALTHPAIRAAMAGEILQCATSGEIVVAVIPLLVESGQTPVPLAAAIVVDCPPDVALTRLERRGLTTVDALARMAAQVDRPARLAAADWVIDNSGPLDQLRGEVDRCWQWLERSRLGSHI